MTALDQEARALDPDWRRTLVVAAVGGLLSVLTSFQVSGVERVPRSGPVLLVSNHRSNADSLFLYTSTPRIVRFMAKEELFLGPLGGLAWWFGGFPIRRGQADRKAVRTALDLLAAGECVGMFPEGTRSAAGRLGRAQAGVGLLAVRSGAPIVPVAITGTGSFRSWTAFLRRPKLTLTIGEPFTIAGDSGHRVSAADAADEIMRRIAALLPPEMHGEYANQPILGRA